MKEAEEEFLKYATPYEKYGEKIELKIKHTMRVKKISKDLAESLNLSKEDVDLAEYCGLLHDIARFEQWKRYGTYDDLKSIDHGNLGYEILKKDHFINRFTKKNHNTILLAVKYHNKYRVPKTLNERNRLFANITRDADKLDILDIPRSKKLIKLYSGGFSCGEFNLKDTLDFWENFISNGENTLFLEKSKKLFRKRIKKFIKFVTYTKGKFNV